MPLHPRPTLLNIQSTSSEPEKLSSKVPKIVVLLLLRRLPWSSSSFCVSCGGNVKLRCLAKSFNSDIKPGSGRLNAASSRGAEGSVEVKPEVTMPLVDLDDVTGVSLDIGGAGNSLSPVGRAESSPSDSSLIIEFIAVADLLTLAILSFSLIRSATVPARFSPVPGELDEGKRPV